ncbi:MAG: hypothetical protein K8T26_18440 [Lentisphaerae bacterium]|nr:hypothetical protein [Lentisphaerota bacterium]
MHVLNLNGTWRVRPTALARRGEAGLQSVRRAHKGWLPARVPGEIHLDLIRAGQMREPLVSTQAPRCRWPEQRAWWYRRSFLVTGAVLKAERLQLVFDGLDLNAEVFLNGTSLGTAANAFVPAVFDARPALRAGRNELIVRITCGTELADGRPTPPKHPSPPDLYSHRDNLARVWLRKPQFSYGWDWVDALPNIGIWRGVRLEAHRHVALHDLRLDTVIDATGVRLAGEAVLDNLHIWMERACTLEVRIAPPTGRVWTWRKSLTIPVGHVAVPLSVPIPSPQLWWPNGMGAQPLYRVTASVRHAGVLCDQRTLTLGLRSLRIDRAPQGDGSRFCIQVNGQDVFCKGANWIPADAILARVDRARYDHLVAEARAANINMLRVWGGGVYEDDAFYDACNRAGILVWQDFMFACMMYPDDHAAFRAAVRAEAEAAIRRLRHHPSLALWCGNNENHWGFADWWAGRQDIPEHTKRGGARLYNEILPDACRTLDPARPYWPSSPFGGDTPNAETSGDCHWWHPFTMNPDIRRRIDDGVFDECRARFVSEYGVIGPLGMDSLRDCLKPAERRPQTRAWQVHTNTFEKATLPAAIRRHYAEPEGLPVRDYLLYGQMFQSEMYGRSLEALRFRKHDRTADCQGALIWMFTDCWGENGWTIVDYYRRRKPAFYAFRRACTPVKAIVRRRGRHVVTRMVNDTLKPVAVTLTGGWWRLDGTARRISRQRVLVPANGMVEAAREPIPTAKQQDPRDWIYAATLAGQGIEQAPSSLLLRPWRELTLSPPDIRVAVRGHTVTLTSPVYCHGVHAEDHGRAVYTDNYFDLLPGVPKSIGVLDPARARFHFRAVQPLGAP